MNNIIRIGKRYRVSNKSIEDDAEKSKKMADDEFNRIYMRKLSEGDKIRYERQHKKSHNTK